jgi:hypothetical protein
MRRASKPDNSGPKHLPGIAYLVMGLVISMIAWKLGGWRGTG